jgi:hypothetical protein
MKRQPWTYRAEAGEGGDDGGGGQDPADTTSNDEGARKAIERERQARKDAVRALKEYQAQFEGIDPEEIKTLRESKDKAEKSAQEQLTKAQKQQEIIVQERDTYKNLYIGVLTENQIASAYSELGGQGVESGVSGMQVIARFLRDEIRFEPNEKGTGGRIVIVDENGDERLDKKGNTVTLRARMAELKEEGAFAHYFAPNNDKANGMGMPPVRGTGKRPPNANSLRQQIISDTTLTPMEKIAKAQALGLE